MKDDAPNGERESLTRHVLAAIQSLSPGERLPNERDLSKSLGVSRTALRDRLQLFEAIGVLERRYGAGTFVAELNASSLASLLSLGIAASGISARTFHHVRIALEREAAGLAALHGSKLQFDELAKAAEAFGDELTGDQLFAVDVNFHRALLLASGDSGVQLLTDVFTQVLNDEVAERTNRISQLTSAGVTTKIQQVHFNIYEAVSARDAAAARAAVDYHFEWFDNTAPRRSTTDEARARG
ncbi:FadR/GntR family transcriptional regulator [Agrococcus sp. TSP3-2-1]|uniref:FadR/GntR family transcriptional regulator n=1 Tax=Agrococcus sp. TSP3-2-1 TaxID=2804583 RepID=UPI003CF60856